MKEVITIEAQLALVLFYIECGANNLAIDAVVKLVRLARSM